jgi:hypothetical protein
MNCNLVLLIILLIIVMVFCFNRSTFINDVGIPKNIYICFKDIESIPRYVYESWAKLNSEYSISIFGDKECRAFIGQNYPEEYVDFFDEIPYGPIKADFWRLCILYKLGGIYIDADIEPLVPIREFLFEDAELCICSNYNDKPNAFNPAFLAVKPRNPVILDTLNFMYSQRVMRDHYAKPSVKDYIQLSIVGHIYKALNSVINRKKGQFLIVKDGKKYQILLETCPARKSKYHCYISYNKKRIMNSRYPNYNNDMLTTNFDK